ncbi:putative O-methyltransferase YrrM [Motilibacter rhizosphaerae]|uniref:Putative O-methyltransferase YrrM n=1 Tax=Motilibacter rhizosphaerae TaxID=598652 RepID=A0A4V2F4D7_9ACTN|nr:class I SAM-dependent methyltransferase [Motilibacter rhizosphaerae]RZS87247.1 putative O-methyltransferase YrrM [Motilibacter rhizosphaerae]
MRDATWDYTQTWAGEDEVLTEARARAAELGVTPVGTGTAAALRLLAAALDARAVVEIGTGTGVSGVALLRGMRPDGVLTTVDIEPEHQRAAKEAYAAAGFAPGRARVISGRALDVLPRLADGSYDLVLADGDEREYAAYLEQALRLLRPGGLLAVDGALADERVPDPAQRDERTTAVRDLLAAVKADDRLVPALLPVGDGLLAAVKRG